MRAVQGLVSRSGVTGVGGSVVFGLDAGAWSLIVSASGYENYVATITVTALATVTATLTANVITQPTDPLLATVAFFARDFGVDAPGIPVSIRLAYIGTVVIDNAYEAVQGSANGAGVTDANGELLFTLYPTSVLIAAGVPASEAYYLVSSSRCRGLNNAHMTVPDGGGNVAELIAATIV